MDEFLEKLAEDQRRMRKFLRTQGNRFMKIGKSLAIARERGSRIFVVGEPPLDGLTSVLADEYLNNLPGVALRLEDPTASQDPAPDQGGELEPAAEAGPGPPPIARHLSRHFRSGDVIIVLAHAGTNTAIKALLGFAKLKGVYAILIGGLEARDALRRAADTAVTLPTKGVKTICESSLIVARILARCARAHIKSGEDEAAKLLRVLCGACKEPVFVEERYRGKKGMCPLCRAALKLPDASGEIAPAHTPAVAEATSDRITLNARGAGGGASINDSDGPTKKKGTSSRRKPKKPLKQSVMNLPAAAQAEIEQEVEERGASERARAIVGAAGATTSGAEEIELDDGDDLPPVGLESREGPADIVIAPEDVAFDEFANATDSADPFALPDAFVADLVMPQTKPKTEGGPPPSDANPLISGSDFTLPHPGAGSSDRVARPSSRLVSSRFTVQDCRLRFGRGGYPDETSPEHALEALSASGLVFALDADDELGPLLEKNDELWVRLVVPAFLEPVLARGTVKKIGGSSTGGRGGATIELEWKDLDAQLSRKIARAAETLATA